MAFSKTDFTLAWFAPPDQQDFANLVASHVQRVMMPYQLAYQNRDLLTRLMSMGRHLIVRTEQDYVGPTWDIAVGLNAIRRVIPVDAVIFGTEADNGVDFRFGAPDWQEKAPQSAARVWALMQAVRMGVSGLTTVAPAMTWPPEMISEDGTPQPGRTSWQDIVRLPYDSADGVASHCGYVLGWDGNAVNEWRFKVGLKREVETWHKPLWIDECTYPTDNDVAQMRCAIDEADIIMAGECKDRVRMLCPFISTGFVNGSWDKKYIIRDPAAYTLLGEWMQS